MDDGNRIVEFLYVLDPDRVCNPELLSATRSKAGGDVIS